MIDPLKRNLPFAILIAANVMLTGCRPSAPVAPTVSDTSVESTNSVGEDVGNEIMNEVIEVPVDSSPIGDTFNEMDAKMVEIETDNIETGDIAVDADGQSIRILAWNIESDGANADVIGDQLRTLGRYDIYGFTEVRPQDWPAIKEALGDGFIYWYSRTGYDDRTAFAISKFRFDVIKNYEMKEFATYILNPGNYRSPNIYELKDRATGKQFLIMLNHLARGKAEIRQEQAEGLREWAKTIDQPIIAIGDYNFDYVFETKKGNRAFDLFMADDTYQWVVPEPLIDSNWYDGDKDGVDDYPGSILDFAFVTGEAKSWNPKSKVIVREGDFPDDQMTSDHRPVELVLTP